MTLFPTKCTIIHNVMPLDLVRFQKSVSTSCIIGTCGETPCIAEPGASPCINVNILGPSQTRCWLQDKTYFGPSNLMYTPTLDIIDIY